MPCGAVAVKARADTGVTTAGGEVVAGMAREEVAAAVEAGEGEALREAPAPEAGLPMIEAATATATESQTTRVPAVYPHPPTPRAAIAEVGATAFLPP